MGIFIRSAGCASILQSRHGPVGQPGSHRGTGGVNFYGFTRNNPISSIDYLGLWTTPAHEQIIDDWLRSRFPQKVHCGCCTIDLRQLLKNASARSDGFSGVRGFHWFPNLNPFSGHSFFHQQSTGASDQHAMSQPAQDPSDAEDAFNDFVDDQVNAADQALNGSGNSCRKLKKAIAALGSAVHAAADNHSPEHSGFQEWDGLGHAITHPEETHAHSSGEGLDAWNNSDKQSTLDDLDSRFGPLIDRIMRGCK